MNARIKKNIYFKSDNPFYFNITWLSSLAALMLLVLNIHCIESVLPELLKHVFIGILYSAIVLLINEIVLLKRDRNELGKLEGSYYRKEWFEKMENGLRTESLSPEVIAEKKISGKIARPGSSYYQFSFGFGREWQIDLKYLYKGSYKGKAKYPDYWRNKTEESEVNINIHLSHDLSTGTGTYSYSDVSDFGRYVFQISKSSQNELIIQYKNIIPSGIAEGYEIWVKL